MNILMIYPKYPVTFWSFKYTLKYISKKAAFPPLGLLTVAAMLPKEWNLQLVDLNVRRLEQKELEWADYVMISAMLVQKDSAREILENCKRLQKKVIAGGPLFTSKSEDYIHLVDHLILNEAECTLPQFLADLKNGTSKKVYRSNSFPSLRNTPLPRWDIVKTKYYALLMIQFSRGCPFNCEFCDVTSLFGHNPRTKTDDQFLQELQAIYDTGWRGSLFVVDDNFIGNKKAIKAMLPHVIEWMKAHKYPFEMLTETSINIADDDQLIQLMTEAGFTNIFIGLETPNEESLKECSKNQNCKRDMTAAIKKLQAAGLQVFGGYIVGFDNDDESIFARQIKFIQETGVVTAMVGLLNALPNTKLWHRLKKENRLADTSSGDNTDGSINFIPRMDKAKLIAGYNKIVKTIYSPRYYYQRINEFLKTYKPIPIIRKNKYSLQRLKALFKSVFYIGILGNGASQWYYWKLMLKSLFIYRKSFAEAMTLMVYGYHFRKIAKKL
ncbi:MAG: B12-binding domain-containing radical SAM protein [Deltaproteobacteria bacterium RBG_16_44_11]|nr:MAG: B12-binding domain-containing radical SAM protein [Deltaproteobacteria bacterium RBG_16_44_11]